jgi:excinuclease UvrABC nuclease subunit
MFIFMKNEVSNWRSVSYSRHGRESVPESPGVYAILRINRVMGLPMLADPIYIGKSKNLRIRMGRHLDPATAHNEHVGAVNDRESLEFWCNLMPSEQITVAEKNLIQLVKPKANKIRY